MPYSTTMYCVSPSTVGDSASIMAAPATDDACGKRCLSILNSWDSGNNSISQTFTLPKGEYKLSFLAQYVCANEMRHINDYTIATTGDNLSIPLRHPFRRRNIQISGWPAIGNRGMPFSLEAETQVTVSMGLETTAGVGAAYNTRLYIDQVKLYSKDEIINDVSGILGEADTENVDVYNLPRHEIA